jgi:hypothetical protein
MNKRSVFVFPLAVLSLLLLGACKLSSSSSSSQSSSLSSGESSATSSSSLASSSSDSTSASTTDSTSSSSSASGSSSFSASSSASSSSSSTTVIDGAAIVLADGASSTSASSGVTINNTTNEIVISTLGTYTVSGTLSNGNIRITAEETDDDDTVTLILNGISITKTAANNVYAPIYSVNSAHLVIEKYEGTFSTIVDKRSISSYSGDDTAAIFSNKKLKVLGEGSLTVTSTFENGIATDTHLEANGGTLSVTAVDHSVKAHDSIILGDKTAQGTFVIKSTDSSGSAVRVDEVDTDVTTQVYGNDEADDDIAGIEIKDGTYTINAAGKGISSEAYLFMEGGSGTIVSTADKGIKAELDLYLDGGSYAITSKVDDCVHSSTAEVICNGGTYTLASGTTDGCQGLKGETEVIINGGSYAIVSSYEGIAAHKITVNGGSTVVNASDDGWSAGGTNSVSTANCQITITGGTNYIYATGDGLDSNGDITVTGGTTIVSAPSSGNNGPLDYGDGGSYYLKQSGGILVAYGTSGMAVGSTGTQNSILLSTHASMASGKYYVFLVAGEYYAIKATRSTSTVYASFPGYAKNAYAIYSASSVTISSTVYETGYLYKVSAYVSSSTLINGTFSGTTGSNVTSSSGGGGGR